MKCQSRNRRDRSSRKRKRVEGWKKGHAERWDNLSFSERREILDNPSFVYVNEDGEHLNEEDALGLWRRACMEKWPLHERKPILRSMNPNDRRRVLSEMNLVQVWQCSDNHTFKAQAIVFSWILLIGLLAFIFS